MYFLSVENHFSSAHQLREYKGKCENLHGHNWLVKLTVMGKELGHAGMLIDFKDLKAALKTVMEYLDHGFLNEIKPFDKINPSAENIACYIFEEMKTALSKKSSIITVYKVDIWESEKSCATYINPEAGFYHV
ncbi:MAG TPA: 6-carboxytetrahydropterin synthase QueD [Spirochaetia bacterium]|nr:MAG: 6-carboxytetrahydropterin synthase QueD [Spirochaetes bacterium GWB1_36_13]HCL57869.1 6-carboxytetrahydropterin synthase QueD [Spirochaetia bacterium]